jgi:hypothetical protein
MGDDALIPVLKQPCEAAVRWLVARMHQAGLSVMRTFDLQASRHIPNGCHCPLHGMDSCDCQVVVLLVYAGKRGPVTLVAHGNSESTWFSMVNTPQQRADPKVEASIRGAVAVSPAPPL